MFDSFCEKCGFKTYLNYDSNWCEALKPYRGQNLCHLKYMYMDNDAEKAPSCIIENDKDFKEPKDCSFLLEKLLLKENQK